MLSACSSVLMNGLAAYLHNVVLPFPLLLRLLPVHVCIISHTLFTYCATSVCQRASPHALDEMDMQVLVYLIARQFD